MIRILRTSIPPELAATQTDLTAEFIASQKDVWNKKYIRDALLLMSHSKCSYCECKIGEESKYLEVDHFKFKQGYPASVVEWDNLLSSCKRCNVNKKDHDVLVEPIVNPTNEDPRDHLVFDEYRLKGKTAIGKSTVIALNLNQTERTVQKRFYIGEAIKEKLQGIDLKLSSYKLNTSTRLKNKILNSLEGLLSECCKPAEYAATAATILFNDEIFVSVKSELKTLNLWSQELDDLEILALSQKLEKT